MKLHFVKRALVPGRVLVLILLLAALGSCEDTNCIKGEGSVETRALELQPFTRIEANGDFKVYITQGATQKVEVKGEPNILDQLDTNINNGTWKIQHRECVRRSKGVEVFITLPEVQALYLNGSGLIASQTPIMATELPVTVNGSGKIDLNVTASKVITRVIGSGKIVLQGEAPLHQVDISGSGSAEAFNLVSDNVMVNLSGSGMAEVTASAILDVIISGSGNVYYKGNPAVTQNVSGSGKVVKR